MKTLEDLRKHTPHDAMLTGNNASYIAAGYFPTEALMKLLPRAISVPSPDVMESAFPTVKKIEGMHPFVLMFSNCNHVHDVMTEIELRPYRELMFFVPVTYTHGDEERLCSYIPVMYLEYLLGVIGGLYLGLRKQFHPKMKDLETEKSKSFLIEGVLEAHFEKDPTDTQREIDPFFAQAFANPTVTVSYLNRTYFYTTSVVPSKVLDTTHQFEWHYKGSVIKSNKDTFANYSEYCFTTSQAMRYDAYFHPTYSVGARVSELLLGSDLHDDSRSRR